MKKLTANTTLILTLGLALTGLSLSSCTSNAGFQMVTKNEHAVFDNYQEDKILSVVEDTENNLIIIRVISNGCTRVRDFKIVRNEVGQLHVRRTKRDLCRRKSFETTLEFPSDSVG